MRTFQLRISVVLAKPFLLVISPICTTLSNSFRTAHTCGRHRLMHHQNLIREINLTSP